MDRQPIYLLIDGECVLCHGITRFTVKRDSARRFRFAALQSPAGQWLLKRGNLPVHDIDTFVMVENNRYYVRSEAALRVLKHLGGLWPCLYLLVFIPAPIRDWVYDRIAGRRYRWFGKRELCLLPTGDLRSRFVAEKEELAGYEKQTDLR